MKATKIYQFKAKASEKMIFQNMLQFIIRK